MHDSHCSFDTNRTRPCIREPPHRNIISIRKREVMICCVAFQRKEVFVIPTMRDGRFKNTSGRFDKTMLASTNRIILKMTMVLLHCYGCLNRNVCKVLLTT